jgi:hypothetical protein
MKIRRAFNLYFLTVEDVMHKFQRLRVLSIHGGAARIILLIVIAVFFSPTIFTASSAMTANCAQQERTPSSAESPESPLTKSSCEKSPIQCNALCQTALSAETQAAELEKNAEKARTKAEKDTQEALFLEEIASMKLQNMNPSKKTSSSRTLSRKDKSLWKIVGIIPRIFVSKEANARSREQEKEAEKTSSIDPSSINSSQEISELLVKSQAASKSAEESKKAAADAKKEADQARAYANGMRQSFNSCLSGMDLQ